MSTPNSLVAPKSVGAGEVHEEVPDGEEELSKIVSFFVYRDVNLLAKFFDSGSFLALEKRFSRLRMLDVSKCFHSIYTHSVTWAVKNKDFAKENSSLYAFEQQFDRLMQRQNYNETNGILVGPELSRIFAEVIFQRIDTNLIKRASENSLIFGKHYEFRRYVDDFFLYANDEETVDLIEGFLRTEVAAYKMYLNEGKADNFSRPFVTPLSAAKREIHRTIYELKDVVDEVKNAQGPALFRGISRRVKSKTLEARLIIGEHGVGFHNVSGWTLSLLKVMIQELVGSASTLKGDEEERAGCIERALWSLLTLVFYVANLDIRVTTTYSLAHVLSVMKHPGFKRLQDRSDWIEHVMLKETIDLLSASHGAFFDRMRRVDAVETFNILIVGAYYLGRTFTRHGAVQAVARELLSVDITYFIYITLKYVFLQDRPQFSVDLANLNSKAIDRVVAGKNDLAIDAELYLLLCDLLSSPDLSNEQKRRLWKEVLPGTPSNQKLKFVAARCGFADWEGVRIGHLIARKRLRPVYE